MSFFRDLRVAFHSLMRSKGLATIVILTLALGIGANAAIFTLVRGVLLKPLVNRDEHRLVYIRQSAPSGGQDNTTFSVPEIKDIEGSVRSLSEFGDFSTMDFTMVGLGEPRVVHGGVVSGNYFDVIGKSVRLSSLGDRSATVIGVLEPSVPYPAETEIIGNLVISPHHLSATMVTGRIHRMTELFGKLAPGATLDQARTELRTVYAGMVKDHPDAYPDNGGFRIDARMLRDEITSGARTVLLVLLAASGLVFIIACSNVANLILARTVRREGELSIRAALGASTGALRRMLLAESLLLCGAGAAIAVMSAQPLVTILARYASRFSVRALDLTVDSSLLWVGVALAVIAAVILAFVPRLPSPNASNGMNLASGGIRITSSTGRRQRVFAVTQIAASFVLLAGACMLITTLLALQRTQNGMDTRHVLAIDVPWPSNGRTPQQVIDFYKESVRQIFEVPGATETAVGMIAPWRDAGGGFGIALQFSGDGHVHGKDDPRALWRIISPGFFIALGVPIVAGRDFNALDDQSRGPVVIVSATLAQRMFPGQEPINRHVYWTDPVLEFMEGTADEKARVTSPHRIIGVAADVDDDHIVPVPTSTVYDSYADGGMFGGHLFIHTTGNPYALVTPVTKIIRQLA